MQKIKQSDCTVDLIVQGSRRDFLLRLGLKSHMKQNLCDPQIVVLSLAVICVCFMYVYKLPRNRGCIKFQMREKSYKKIAIS